ncbi:MAG: hypothetical protein FWG47_01710 [Propionibacteriaceae bacterium]|nr:hypothetical protein [Propionibacteriaceae bacterium]
MRLLKSKPEPTSNATTTVSQHALRTRQLLWAGLVGGHISAICCIVVFGIWLQAPGAATAAIFAALTLLFFTIGQAVQVIVADADPRVVLITALASYVARVTILGVLLLLALNNLERFDFIRPVAAITTTFVTVVGWLGAEFWMFSKLRIPRFDPPSEPAPTHD